MRISEYWQQPDGTTTLAKERKSQTLQGTNYKLFSIKLNSSALNDFIGIYSRSYQQIIKSNISTNDYWPRATHGREGQLNLEKIKPKFYPGEKQG